MATQGLAGVRVIEIGTGVAPAYGGWLLSSLGATVTKVADPADRTRRQAQGVFFKVLNRGKDVVPLQGGATAALPSLLSGADVLLEGLAWPEYEALKPALDAFVARGGVVASVSTFGRSGPYRSRRGFSLQAVAGSVAYRMGQTDLAPLTFPLEAADYIGGVATAAGALLALRARGGEGSGQYVDVSVLDVLTNVFNRNGVAQAAVGGPVQGGRNGARLGKGLIGLFPCQDGYISLVTLLYKHWERYFESMGGAELLKDPRYDLRGNELAPDAREELTEIQHQWLANRTRAELFEFFQEIRVPFQPVNTIHEVLDEPHLTQRQFWEEFRDGNRTFKVPAATTRNDTGRHVGSAK